jgi:hypothetical protein
MPRHRAGRRQNLDQPVLYPTVGCKIHFRHARIDCREDGLFRTLARKRFQSTDRDQRLAKPDGESLGHTTGQAQTGKGPRTRAKGDGVKSG